MEKIVNCHYLLKLKSRFLILISLNDATGKNYQSLFYLLDEVI